MKLQEWEVISQCNYNCEYCSLPNYKYESNKKRLSDFMKSLDKDTELFLFGGEPLLHPSIEFIIKFLSLIKQPFVIQSNGSYLKPLYSGSKINLQISIHPTQIDLITLEKTLVELKYLEENKNIILRRIDTMYSGKKSLEYYHLANSKFKEKVFLTPVSGFYDKDKNGCHLNKEYLELSQKARDIRFEDIQREGIQRAELWYKQCIGEVSTMGRHCPYDYTLYDSLLRKYNCCYRENTEGVCNHEKCFWM